MRIIDIHTHGIGGYDTRAFIVEEILKVAEIHGSHGVSDILLSIYPDSIDVMRRQMETARKAMQIQESVLRRGSQKIKDFLGQSGQGSELRNQKALRRDTGCSELKTPNISNIIGLHLEGPFLNPVKCGALDPASFIEPTEYNLVRLIEGFEDIIKVITIAPEIKGSTGLIRRISGMGIIASMGHSDATYEEAEAGYNAGARGITHIFNAMRGIHHREPGIAGFGLLNEDIYIEVIADPFHLHPKTLEIIFRIKNTEMIIIVSDSVKGTKSSSDKNGVRGIDGKLRGGGMTITESTERLAGMGFDRDITNKCISENPARHLKITT